MQCPGMLVFGPPEKDPTLFAKNKKTSFALIAAEARARTDLVSLCAAGLQGWELERAAHALRDYTAQRRAVLSPNPPPCATAPYSCGFGCDIWGCNV